MSSLGTVLLCMVVLAGILFVAVSAGDKARDSGAYPDIDMVFGPDGYTRRDGTPYPTKRLP